MKKIICAIIMVIGVFGFIGLVNAEESWSSIGEDVGFITDLIEGEDLSSNEELTNFLSKYDVYYKYYKIDDTLYQNYLSDLFEGTNLGAEDSIMSSYIPTVEDSGDLGSWLKVSGSNLAFANLEYDETKDTGYIVGIAAVDKEDNSKIYVYRGVFEVSSSSTLVDSYTTHATEYQEGTTNTTTTTTTEETVATESNPNTGISDYAYILVPLALVGGSVLMLKRRYA